MIASGGVTALRAVELAVTDLAAASRFFIGAWNLKEEARGGGRVYFRGSGTFRWILALREGDRTEIDAVVLDVGSRADLDLLHGRVSRLPGSQADKPAPLGTPGGGWGFRFSDPEGRSFLAVAEVEDHLPAAEAPDRPRKISHVNLNTADFPASSAFFREVLGFRVSDQTRKMQFLRCNGDHHSVVLAFANHATLNHIAFEMPDLDSLMRGIGRLRDHGHPVEWGPGRHGPGNNVFAYFVGPENLPLEYTTDMQQCGEGHEPQPVESWSWPPGRLDHWGLTPGPSARFEETQIAFPFSAAAEGAAR